MAGQADMGMASDEADSDSEAEAEVTLEEILAELEEENESVADVMSSPGSSPEGNIPEMEEAKKKEKEDEKGKDKMEEELEEAKTTIEKMRQDLQEVNLLNAKYLYMNKLFKSKSLKLFTDLYDIEGDGATYRGENKIQTLVTFFPKDYDNEMTREAGSSICNWEFDPPSDLIFKFMTLPPSSFIPLMDYIGETEDLEEYLEEIHRKEAKKFLVKIKKGSRS